jgi:hypothetical protein
LPKQNKLSQASDAVDSSLPVGPFYVAVGREDRVPIVPMSSDMEGLEDPPPPRAAVGPPTLASGDHFGRIEFLRERPTDFSHVPGYPLRIYEVRDVAGLRRLGNERYHLVADDVVIDREVEAWRMFGPHGEGVPDVLEAIWSLDSQRVSRLQVPRGRRPFGRIPIELLPVPDSEPGAANASRDAIDWTEKRSWSAGQGGGFYYRGCYFVYIVSDPQWLMAMGLAHNAAVTLALGPNVMPFAREAALRAWANLIDD